MQSSPQPLYVYDSMGKLVNYTASGATNDVITDHYLLDPRISLPRQVLAAGLARTVLNSPHLFTLPVSLTSPPVIPVKNENTVLGYANAPLEEKDLYGITSSKPIMSLDTHLKNSARNSMQQYET